MGLINRLFKWYTLDRLRQLDEVATHPLQFQSTVLKSLIYQGSKTAIGKQHSFNTIADYSDFARQVPVYDYNALKPFIQRSMEGEEAVLWPSTIEWYAKSSGTTEDRSKFIPVSKEAMQDCHFKAGRDMYAFFYDQFPDSNLLDGRTLVLGGSRNIVNIHNDKQVGDLSAVLMANLPFWAEMKRVPLLSIALMDDWEEKLDKMAEATIHHNVSHILGVPTWTVLLIKRIFEITGKTNILDVWPNLELYVHGGISFLPYTDLFQTFAPGSQLNYLETYNASEGYFGFQNDFSSNDFLLLVDHGIFYEFIEVSELDAPNPNIIPLEGVKLDTNYAMIITTNAGLWRYNLGDTIRFTSLAPYKFLISGRTKFFINAFGEELIVENAEAGIKAASQSTGALVTDFSAAPVYFQESKANGAHEWLIEFERTPDSLEQFTIHLDSNMRALNSDYDAKRKHDLALGMPIVHPLPPNSFNSWLKNKGKLGGQNKVPRLSNSRDIIEDLKSFLQIQ